MSDQNPTDKQTEVLTPLFAAVRGSVGARTLPRGSDIIIIIIIIKKVKIIVTLSIKNTAGALYKSQGSGVRVSVSFQQKYPPGSVLRCPTAAENGVMTKGVVSGGLTSVSGV